MSVQDRPQVPLEAAQALARHLREKPEAAEQEPASLAREFALPSEFVREFLASLAQPREATAPKPAFQGLKRGLHAVRLLFRRLTANPLPFIGVTAAVSIFGYILLDLFVMNGPGEQPIASTGRGVRLAVEGNEFVFLGFALSTLLLHLACYFRHGMVRYPFFGGLVCWLISAPTLMVIVWLDATEKARNELPLALIGLALGMLVLNGIYASLGAMAAVVGGAWRIRQQDRERGSLGRQELLERMFDIQERLQATEGAKPAGSERVLERLSVAFKRRSWAYSIVGGVGINLIEVVLFGVVFQGQLMSGSKSPFMLLAGFSVQVLYLMLLVSVGFFTGSTLRAILNSWLFIFSGLPVMLIPAPGFGPKAFQGAISPGALAFQIALGLVVAAVASAGAKVEERATQERRLRENDPAALLAELVRLQWQLSPQTSDVCVLVADAARSAEMKSSADPWAVEYSFREYQGFLEDVVHANGGSVLSTAGDGAVAEFPHVAQAYAAARQIQTEIEDFNRRINRLDKPFRLRIGLHLGPVAGCINDVEFSAVIDIAAHVQAAAPIGGITLTGAVKEHLGDEPVAKLADPVDEQEVFLSLRPVRDE